MEFGRTDFFQIALVLACILATFQDLWWGKLYNRFNVTLALIGVIYSFSYLGWSGVLQSLLGMSLALVLYGWMFTLRFLGGGDVKYLMALGSWGGPKFILEVAILAVLVGGFISFVSLLRQRKLSHLLQRLYRFLLSIFVSELEVEPLEFNRSMTIPFGVAISISVLWILFLNPLEYWGVFKWL